MKKRGKAFASLLICLLKVHLVTSQISEDDFKNHTWAGKYDPDERRNILARWLLNNCVSSDVSECYLEKTDNIEYEGYDGWYNNLARADSGAIDRPLLRRWPAAYKDGSYEPSGSDRPNPMELSEKLLKLEQVGTTSPNGKSAFLVFFGQQLVEEILDAQRPACPPEYFNIEIPEGHRLRNETNHSVLPLLRTRYDMRTGYSPNNPRQQLNEITPYFDGGLFYGTSKAWADYLRTGEDGELEPHGLLAATRERNVKGLFPAYNKQRLPMANPPPPVNHSTFVKDHETLKVERFFKLGNPRGNENTFLLTFGILWFRWHNYLASNLKELNPGWNGERVFNEARKWVIATHQHVVVDAWLPIWLGEPLGPYNGYDPSIDPQIDQFFQAVAMRFGHTLVVPGVYLRDYSRNGCGTDFATWPRRAVRTCNAYWRPQDAILRKVKEGEDEVMDIDRLLMGMASQLCEKEDHKIVEDLRGNVFGPLEFSRRDLMAINIQRARDHGLPDYNSARRAFNLAPVEFEDIDRHFSHVSKEIRDEFRRIHNLSADRMDVIDPWVGGILETTSAGPGELFRTVIKDQFRRIRDGDRFWFENERNGHFTRDEIERIKTLTVYDIVMAVTKMDHDDIPKDPFRVYRNANETPGACREFATTVSGGTQYVHLPPLTPEVLQENCTSAGTYDYFNDSEVSYVLTFLALGTFVIGNIGLVIFVTKYYAERKSTQDGNIMEKMRESFVDRKIQVLYSAQEWVGTKELYSPVVIILNAENKTIEVNTQKGKMIRIIDLKIPALKLELFVVGDRLHLVIRKKNEHDLFLKFDSELLRNNFVASLEDFIGRVGVEREQIRVDLKTMFKQAISKKDRQKSLDTFFRVIFAQAFGIKHSREELMKIDSRVAEKVVHTEITITEFADALSMPADGEFIIRIFNLVDKDKKGSISFREFLDLLYIFSKGTPKERARLLFDMYDIDKTEFLSLDAFGAMIRSLMDTSKSEMSAREIDSAVDAIKQDFARAGKNGISFEELYSIFKNDIEKIGQIGIATKHKNYEEQARDALESLYEDPRDLMNRVKGETSSYENMSIIDQVQERQIRNITKLATNSFYYRLSRTIENYFREIFWVVLFTFVTIAIFAERAYYYSVEREHSGLRRIAGYGVAITRGAASAQMFTYSVLLLTMSRNTISYLRETFLNYYVPFDRALDMHKYIALWALFFTVVHVVGHAFNFYSISTQTADDLTCLFRNYFHATHELPKFHYWCWQTMTGFTGACATLIGAVIYVTAMPGVKRNIFWFGHSLYRLFYVLMFLHGTGRLIQAPYFPYFFVGPLLVYAIDSIVSARRKKVEIRVLSSEKLPSDVTKLEFKRPNNFEYKSGQWVRIACLGLNAGEFHPFTLSSSPMEDNLTVHIRAVGPWTHAVRNIYDPNNVRAGSLPKIHVDGPYGEGHQDWGRFDVSVLVGGGIGVTPFASILKDIVFQTNRTSVKCQKVYFIWVTKTQKQFEWLVDIIRELEMSDKAKTVSSHIFITQFYDKFDLRTTLLYLCERHFQRISGGRSLFTGLKAVTHFGRPQFAEFFKSIQKLHPDVLNIGVFSCGPPPMISQVDNACLQLNKYGSGNNFQHHYKIF